MPKQKACLTQFLDWIEQSSQTMTYVFCPQHACHVLLALDGTKQGVLLQTKTDSSQKPAESLRNLLNTYNVSYQTKRVNKAHSIIPAHDKLYISKNAPEPLFDRIVSDPERWLLGEFCGYPSRSIDAFINDNIAHVEEQAQLLEKHSIHSIDDGGLLGLVGWLPKADKNGIHRAMIAGKARKNRLYEMAEEHSLPRIKQIAELSIEEHQENLDAV